MAKKQRKIVLDSNILFELIRKNQKHVNQVDVIPIDSLYVSSINVLETLYGMRKKEQLITKQLLNSLTKLVPDKAVFKLAEELMYEYFDHRPSLPDCIIASQCLLDNCELYTLNVKDFDYMGVKIFKPL
jgi:tRNA(fMet)-specific endonuclease VapC